MAYKDLLSSEMIRFLEYKGISVNKDALGTLEYITAHWRLGKMCCREFLSQNNNCDGWPDLDSFVECNPQHCPFLLVTKPKSSEDYLDPQKFPVYRETSDSIDFVELRQSKAARDDLRKGNS